MAELCHGQLLLLPRLARRRLIPGEWTSGLGSAKADRMRRDRRERPRRGVRERDKRASRKTTGARLRRGMSGADECRGSVWPGVGRASLPKAEPGADAGPGAAERRRLI
jgi:hypothetical protein